VSDHHATSRWARGRERHDELGAESRPDDERGAIDRAPIREATERAAEDRRVGRLELQSRAGPGERERRMKTHGARIEDVVPEAREERPEGNRRRGIRRVPNLGVMRIDRELRADSKATEDEIRGRADEHFHRGKVFEPARGALGVQVL
jgi:hypothetical protein